MNLLKGKRNLMLLKEKIRNNLDALPMGDTGIKCLYINSHQQGIGGNQNTIDRFVRIDGVLEIKWELGDIVGLERNQHIY